MSLMTPSKTNRPDTGTSGVRAETRPVSPVLLRAVGESPRRPAVSNLPSYVLTDRLFARGADGERLGYCMRTGAVPDDWFPPTGVERTLRKIARELCAGCPVKAECLEVALREGEIAEYDEGIRGGSTQAERAELRRARKEVPAA